MQTSRPRRRDRASVTLMSLCLTTALGIALSSYLALCSRSGESSTRLLHQEKAQELAQVGLEEAMWALNEGNWTGSGPDGATAWTVSGADQTVVLTFSLPGQGATGRVALTVSNFASTGPAWPVITAAATVTLQGGQVFTKTLRADTGPAPLFGNAIASSESYVSFTAGGTVDSWNSDPDSNPATPAVPYSCTAGNPGNYAAVVAGRTNGSYGVILTQAAVHGYAATFGQPISHSTSGAPLGRVLGPATPASVSVDSGRVGKSAFIPVASVFNVTLPSTSGPNFGGLINNVLELVAALLAAPPGTDVYKTSGNLNILGLPLLAPSLTIDRPIKLIVNGDLNIAGAGKITITPTGSLELFVTGDVTIGGNGMANQTLEPKKLAVFCTSGAVADALEYTTAAGFCGVIFCENKPIDIRQNATFHGALLSRQYVRFSTNATAPVFHYDTALRQVRFSGVTTPYLIQRVTES